MTDMGISQEAIRVRFVAHKKTIFALREKINEEIRAIQGLQKQCRHVRLEGTLCPDCGLTTD